MQRFQGAATPPSQETQPQEAVPPSCASASSAAASESCWRPTPSAAGALPEGGRRVFVPHPPSPAQSSSCPQRPSSQQETAVAAAAAAQATRRRRSFVDWLSFNLAHFIELWGGDDFSRRSSSVRGASLGGGLGDWEKNPLEVSSRQSWVLRVGGGASREAEGDALAAERSSAARGGGANANANANANAAGVEESACAESSGDSTAASRRRAAAVVGASSASTNPAAFGSAVSSKEFWEEPFSGEGRQGSCDDLGRGGGLQQLPRRRARNPLRFANGADEEAYRRYLNGLYPFRLLVVGILMLFVDLLQIIWIFVLEGSPSSVPFTSSLRIHPSVFRCVIAAFASHVLLYALLAVAAKIPVLSKRLEATSLTLLALAFLSRVICLCVVASLTSSEHRSGCTNCGQLFAEAVSDNLKPLPGEYLAFEVAEQEASFRSAATETVTSELLLLSTAALFHTLIVDVMLPVRTMKSLFVHLLYIVSCAGVVIYCALLYGTCLPYMGPVCVVSSCIFLLCGLLGRVQSELSHRQLYDRWRRSTRLLLESERQLRSQHGAQTGIEKLAFFVRRSVAILRTLGSLTQRDFATAQLQIEQVATLQAQVLEIATDVHNVYHARISKEHLQEVVRFIPEMLEAPVSLREPAEASASEEASPRASAAAQLRVGERLGASASSAPCEEGSQAEDGGEDGPATALLECPFTDLKAFLTRLGGSPAAEGKARLLGVEWDLDILQVIETKAFASSRWPRCCGDGVLSAKSATTAASVSAARALQLDSLTGGNVLLLAGQTLLLPLKQREGLQSSASQIMGFVQCMQHQYCSSNSYHNATHAAMVVHCCKVLASGLLCNGSSGLTPLEEAALMIGSLAHDVGHPGLTNQYLINVRSPLAVTYNDISVLENYHASCCFRTAASPEFNVFHGLTKECFQYLRQHIIELILATDMKLHFDVISHLRVRKGTPTFNVFGSPQDRWIFFKACIKGADLAHAAMPWSQHQRWSELLAEEFYRQGDAEKRQGLPVSNLCDRQLRREFSRSQADFIKVVVTPLFVEISEVVRRQPGQTPEVSHRIDKNIGNNIEQWKLLHEQEQRDGREEEQSQAKAETQASGGS